MPKKTKEAASTAKKDPKTQPIVLKGTRAATAAPQMPPEGSLWSQVTIMIPRPRPDWDTSAQKQKLKKRIQEIGLKEAVNEVVEAYYRWEDDLDPASARRKRWMTLIFSKAELRALVPNEMYKLLGSFEFLGNTGDDA